MKVIFEFNTPLTGGEALIRLSEDMSKMAFVYQKMGEDGRFTSMLDIGAGCFSADGSKLVVSEVAL